MLNVIKNTILKNRDDRLRKASVEAVTAKLQRLAEHTLALQLADTMTSPGRVRDNRAMFIHSMMLQCTLTYTCTPRTGVVALRAIIRFYAIAWQDSHNGGSLVGRHTLRAIRAIVDKHASQMTSHTGVQVLNDVTSSQVTPLHFPSLINKFRYCYYCCCLCCC